MEPWQVITDPKGGIDSEGVEGVGGGLLRTYIHYTNDLICRRPKANLELPSRPHK